jgi:hypothetical protein
MAAAGFVAGTGIVVDAGFGILILALDLATGAGCFDQPMSERVAGFGVEAAIVVVVAVELGVTGACFDEMSLTPRETELIGR